MRGRCVRHDASPPGPPARALCCPACSVGPARARRPLRSAAVGPFSLGHASDAAHHCGHPRVLCCGGSGCAPVCCSGRMQEMWCATVFLLSSATYPAVRLQWGVRLPCCVRQSCCSQQTGTTEAVCCDVLQPVLKAFVCSPGRACPVLRVCASLPPLRGQELGRQAVIAPKLQLLLAIVALRVWGCLACKHAVIRDGEPAPVRCDRRCKVRHIIMCVRVGCACNS